MVRKKRSTSSQSSSPMMEQTEMDTERNMNKKAKFPLILILILALAAVLFYFKSIFIVALVNGQPISRASVISDLEKQGGKKVLDSLIVRTLIQQEAQKKNINVAQSDIDKEVKKIEANFSQQGQNIDQLLAMQGMTKKDLQEQIKIQVMLEKLLGDKVKVTEKEIDQYLAQNKNAAGDTGSTTPTPTPAREQIRQQLSQQKMQSEAQKYVEELRKKAKITQFVTYQ